MLRKDFLKNISLLAGAGLAAPLLSSYQTNSFANLKIKKGLGYWMIQEDLSILDKFKLVKDLGFHGIEFNAPLEVPIKELIDARDKTGIELPSLVNKDHWNRPLSDPDPKVREFIVESVVNTVQETKMLGGNTVLVVPGIVNEKVSYETAWKNSIATIRQILPRIENTGVKLGIENVWNNFLISPVEAKMYLEEINHPAVGWYFDIGNVMRYGWPEHWIETLGSKILKFHIKEFSRQIMNNEGLSKGFGVELTKGDIDWAKVMKSIQDIKYKGEWMTLEVGRGDRTHLQKLSDQFDTILGYINS